MPKVILVTTAGKVGSEAARLLTQRQVPVRVLVRDPEKGKAMADAGVEIAVGDLDIPESINQAMAGVTSVVLVSPAVPAQELNVIASAARAGIEHAVKATSKASADSPIARRRGQAEIEAGLAASGLPHTAIRCLDAEHVGVGTGDCQDEKLRFLGSQGPCRYGRRPRRRSGGGRNRRFAGPTCRKDLLAFRPLADLQLRRG